MIPYGRQSISAEDIAAVVEVLSSDFLTQGPAVEHFERVVAEYCGAAHSVAVSNGTAALHLAALALDLGPGKLLWTSPITFVASANAGRYCGADVDFVDIDPVTLNIDPSALDAKLQVAEKAGRLPDVVVAVDFGGLSADFVAIRELADKYGFAVIEDAAHSLGGTYRGERVGSGRWADVTTFSFHPVKTVTSGEGGMVVTNDAGLAERLKLLRSHGITREEALMQGTSEGGWYYQQVDLGFNFRITDIQAALGASQMGRLDAFVARRNELADRYRSLLSGLPLSWQDGQFETYSAHHLFVVQLAEEARPRAEVYDAMREAGIGVNVHYIPVHLQPYYRALGFSAGDFPNAERYYAGALTLPLFPALTADDQDAVVDALRRALS